MHPRLVHLYSMAPQELTFITVRFYTEHNQQHTALQESTGPRS